jgi:hypothetical protein
MVAMAKFKCLQSGNVLEFKNPYDIELLRKQKLDYIEVQDEEPVEQDTNKKTLTLKKPA